MPSPEKPKTLKSAAKKVREWLKGRWLSGKWIETPHGAYAGDCKACLHGAAVYIGGKFGPELSKRLCDTGCTVEWNDEDGRTEAEVLSALDKIIEAE